MASTSENWKPKESLQFVNVKNKIKAREQQQRSSEKQSERKSRSYYGPNREHRTLAEQISGSSPQNSLTDIAIRRLLTTALANHTHVCNQLLKQRQAEDEARKAAEEAAKIQKEKDKTPLIIPPTSATPTIDNQRGTTPTVRTLRSVSAQRITPDSQKTLDLKCQFERKLETQVAQTLQKELVEKASSLRKHPRNASPADLSGLRDQVRRDHKEQQQQVELLLKEANKEAQKEQQQTANAATKSSNVPTKQPTAKENKELIVVFRRNSPPRNPSAVAAAAAKAQLQKRRKRFAQALKTKAAEVPRNPKPQNPNESPVQEKSQSNVKRQIQKFETPRTHLNSRPVVAVAAVKPGGLKLTATVTSAVKSSAHPWLESDIAKVKAIVAKSAAKSAQIAALTQEKARGLIPTRSLISHSREATQKKSQPKLTDLQSPACNKGSTKVQPSARPAPVTSARPATLLSARPISLSSASPKPLPVKSAKSPPVPPPKPRQVNSAKPPSPIKPPPQNSTKPPPSTPTQPTVKKPKDSKPAVTFDRSAKAGSPQRSLSTPKNPENSPIVGRSEAESSSTKPSVTPEDPKPLKLDVTTTENSSSLKSKAASENRPILKSDPLKSNSSKSDLSKSNTTTAEPTKPSKAIGAVEYSKYLRSVLAAERGEALRAAAGANSEYPKITVATVGGGSRSPRNIRAAAGEDSKFYRAAIERSKALRNSAAAERTATVRPQTPEPLKSPKYQSIVERLRSLKPKDAIESLLSPRTTAVFETTKYPKPSPTVESLRSSHTKSKFELVKYLKSGVNTEARVANLKSSEHPAAGDSLKTPQKPTESRKSSVEVECNLPKPSIAASSDSARLEGGSVGEDQFSGFEKLAGGHSEKPDTDSKNPAKGRNSGKSTAAVKGSTSSKPKKLRKALGNSKGLSSKAKPGLAVISEDKSLADSAGNSTPKGSLNPSTATYTVVQSAPLRAPVVEPPTKPVTASPTKPKPDANWSAPQHPATPSFELRSRAPVLQPPTTTIHPAALVQKAVLACPYKSGRLLKTIQNYSTGCRSTQKKSQAKPKPTTKPKEKVKPQEKAPEEKAQQEKASQEKAPQERITVGTQSAGGDGLYNLNKIRILPAPLEFRHLKIAVTTVQRRVNRNLAAAAANVAPTGSATSSNYL